MYSLSRNVASATTPCTRASASNVVRSVSAHVPRRQPSRVSVVAALALAPSSHHSPLNDPRSARGYATGAFAAIAPRAVATTTIATTRIGVGAVGVAPRARVAVARVARVGDAIARVRVDAPAPTRDRAARRARVCGATIARARPSSRMGRGYKPSRGGRGRGNRQSQEEREAKEREWRRIKRGEDATDSDESDESDDDDDEDETSEEDEAPRRPAPGSLPPNSSDEDESDDDDDDADLRAMTAPREKPKPEEPSADEILAQKSKKELAAEMEKLRLVRERREQQRLARLEADGGVDRYAPGAGKKAGGGGDEDSDSSDSDEDSESD